jgi:hypothetical protein
MLWIQGELGRKYVVGVYITCIERKVFVFALPLSGLSPGEFTFNHHVPLYIKSWMKRCASKGLF